MFQYAANNVGCTPRLGKVSGFLWAATPSAGEMPEFRGVRIPVRDPTFLVFGLDGPSYPFNPERLMPPMMYSCAMTKRMTMGKETIVEPANTAGQLI